MSPRETLTAAAELLRGESCPDLARRVEDARDEVWPGEPPMTILTVATRHPEQYVLIHERETGAPWETCQQYRGSAPGAWKSLSRVPRVLTAGDPRPPVGSRWLDRSGDTIEIVADGVSEGFRDGAFCWPWQLAQMDLPLTEVLS